MSERKVLNKYYPPDFDPTKLPKLKRERNRQFVIRIMAPFSMRCKTCGEYIYKGRKFNSRMETVENETYLGLRIYRFYIRCTKCISEITFKTDPENTDYIMEHGATRNFEAYRKLEERIEKEKKDREEEEANNPMKALENRTKDSKREMESLERLEELRDLNQRIAGIDPEKLIEDHLKVEEVNLEKQEKEDELLIKQIFGGNGSDGYVRRIIDSDDSSDDDKGKYDTTKNVKKRPVSENISDFAPSENLPGPSIPLPKKSKLKTPFDDLSTMIRVKKPVQENEKGKSIDTVDSKKIHDKIDKTEIAEKTEPGIAPLPAYKIKLKKAEDKNSAKMKGNSLNLLGGYDSSDLSSEDG